jgi:endonuclease YncB( thermonuclease family)
MQHRAFSFLVALLLILYLATPAGAETFTGRFVRALSGDSLVVRRGSADVEVRLFGLAAPRPGQPFARQAQDRLETRLAGQTLAVHVRGQEPTGRLLAVVWLGQSLLNREQVKAGLAWADRRASQDYAPDEERARAAKLGVWSEANPVPPWDWQAPPTGTAPAKEGAPAPGSPAPPAAPTAPAAPVAPVAPAGRAVYITRTGTHYHAAGCRHLSKSRAAISLRDALARKLRACSVCRP